MIRVGDPALYVYFARPIGMDGPVKIGCSGQPNARLAGLMAWSPFLLEVAAAIPGDRRLESRFHAAFRRQHSHHEWFRPSPELTATIAAVAEGSFDLTTLPHTPRDPLGHYKGRTERSRRTGGLRIAFSHWMRKRRGHDCPDVVRSAYRSLDVVPDGEFPATAKLVADFVDQLRAGRLDRAA